MTMSSPRTSAEIFTFVPRTEASVPRAYSAGMALGGRAVVDLVGRMPPKVQPPRMDYADGWYHAEAIRDDDRTRKA